jgi:O-antigen ligase
VIPPEVLGVMMVALVLVSTFKFRKRDAQLAIAGVADNEVIREVAVWVLFAIIVGLSMLTAWARRRRGGNGRSKLGPALRALAVVTLVIVASALGTGSTRSVTRAAQWVMLAGLVVLAYREIQRDSEYLYTMWVWIRRAVWAGVVLAALVTDLNPAWGSLYSDWYHIARYRFFLTHPIPTASLLGFALLLLAGSYLGLPDKLAKAPWGKIGRVLLGLFMMYLLLRTKSRGAILALAAGGAVLLLTSPMRNRRRSATFALLLGIGGLAVATQIDVTADRLSRVVFRNQSVEVLMSLNSRTELFDVGFDFFLEKPVFGWGYLTGGSHFLQFFDWAGEAHNAYLAVLFSMGLIGAAAFAGLFFFLVRGIYRALQDSAVFNRALGAEAAGMAAFVLVDGMVGEGFAGPVGVHVLALMLALLLVDGVASQRRERPKRSGSGAGTQVDAHP